MDEVVFGIVFLFDLGKVVVVKLICQGLDSVRVLSATSQRKAQCLANLLHARCAQVADASSQSRLRYRHRIVRLTAQWPLMPSPASRITSEGTPRTRPLAGGSACPTSHGALYWSHPHARHWLAPAGGSSAAPCCH